MDSNGARLLLDEIDRQLDTKRLTEINRLNLRVAKYQLENLIDMRRDVRQLKDHDVISKIKNNPRFSALLFAVFLVVNSMVNWAGIRKPLLQAIILQTTGVLVPLDSLW